MPPVRELWNPWTTAFFSSDASTREVMPALRHPIAGATPLLFASAWERKADGGVRRMTLHPEHRGIATR